MNGNLEWIKFRDSWFDVFAALDKPEMDRLLRAIREFSNDGEVPDLTGRESLAWILIRAELENDKATRQKAADAHRTAGAKGGRPKTNLVTDDNTETKKTNLVNLDIEKPNAFDENQNNQIGTLRVKSKELRDTELRDKNTELRDKSKENIENADAFSRTQKRTKGKHKEREGLIAFGRLNNVMLTEDEEQKLYAELGVEKTERLIDDLSLYIGEPKNAKKYTNHYITLLRWSKHAQYNEPPKNDVDFSDIAKGYEQDDPIWNDPWASPGNDEVIDV